MTPEETPAEAPAPASQKPPEEDSDDDLAPKRTPGTRTTRRPRRRAKCSIPTSVLKRDFPGRDDDLRQLVSSRRSRGNGKPFKLAKEAHERDDARARDHGAPHGRVFFFIACAVGRQ